MASKNAPTTTTQADASPPPASPSDAPTTAAAPSGEATVHIPRSIAHSEVAVNRHKRLQKTKLCKYGEDCAYRAIGRCFYAHSIEEVQPRPPKTDEEIAAEHAETIRNIAIQEQAAAMLAANPWCNPQMAALAATSMTGFPTMPAAYGASATTTAYWAALLAQAATAGELARAAGATAIPSPQLLPTDLMAAAAAGVSSTSSSPMDSSGLLGGFPGLPPAGSLDFALLGLQSGDGLLPTVGAPAPTTPAPPVPVSSNTLSSLLLSKPPGLVPLGETPDASSRAPSVDAREPDASNAHDGLETQSAFGGNRDLSSLGVCMTHKSKSS
ncbi:hypothetical protein FOZ63_032310 [Perkinsus olseni]|uniref:C3H1-type domain-containing protein n=1 Tax=Perkinsus olseni TaxID=32597 RepID=A0A7J6RBZ8_PEROL|nr:hypothetical protein FOZ63_032310 [Perkinsus olseni]